VTAVDRAALHACATVTVPLSQFRHKPRHRLSLGRNKWHENIREGVMLKRTCIVGAGIAALLSQAFADEARQRQQEMLSWIPSRCCVTNQCCWEVHERELISLPNDMWRIRATGQEIARTAWSPDGKFYRCACDQDKKSLQWIKHDGANTRCIFVPMRLGRL
jgi:hypothetical protein